MLLIIKNICAFIGACCIVSFLIIFSLILITFRRDKSSAEEMSDYGD